MSIPTSVKAIKEETQKLGSDMASDHSIGELQRALVATKPAGSFLELGTYTRLASAWMPNGMDNHSSLVTVDDDATTTAIAHKHLAKDPRISIKRQDGLELLQELQGEQFDLTFADTWPGKLEQPELALNLLKTGGMYIVDDMNHSLKETLEPVAGVSDWVLQKIPQQLRDLKVFLELQDDLRCATLAYGTGVMICTKLSQENLT